MIRFQALPTLQVAARLSSACVAPEGVDPTATGGTTGSARTSGGGGRQTPFRNAAQRFLKKTGTAAGVITANSGQTGNLADWRDWTTPTLP